MLQHTVRIEVDFSWYYVLLREDRRHILLWMSCEILGTILASSKLEALFVVVGIVVQATTALCHQVYFSVPILPPVAKPWWPFCIQFQSFFVPSNQHAQPARNTSLVAVLRAFDRAIPY